MPGKHVQGPGGQVQDILRRVAIIAPVLSMNIDRSTNYFDTINVPPGTLSTLHFKLTDEQGNKVNLQGGSFSFSLILFPRADFPVLS